MKGGRVTIDFPGATGYIIVRNDGDTGIRLRFFDGLRNEEVSRLELPPGELAPVLGGHALHNVEIVSYCVHPGPHVHCRRPDCETPCCTHCGHHIDKTLDA